MSGYRASWQAVHLTRSARGVYEAFWRLDPFAAWERNTRPEARAEASLVHGLEVLYADPRIAWGRRFLERALDVAERALQDGWLSSEACGPSFPRNRGRATRVKVYAQALLGRPYDLGSLKRASRDLAVYHGRVPHDLWIEADEGGYLSSARLALLGGEGAAAAALLAQRSFRWYGEEAERLERLARTVVESEAELSYRIAPARPASPWDADHEAWFQQIRAPDHRMTDGGSGELARFEVGALRRGCLATLATSDAWVGVIEDIAQ